MSTDYWFDEFKYGNDSTFSHSERSEGSSPDLIGT